MTKLYPLRFQPLLRRYLWGGRRLETVLGKSLPPGEDYAESWELVDHSADQSIATHGPLAGHSLRRIVQEFGHELFGSRQIQHPFPLLFKFLDAERTLSVQVHPDDQRGAQLEPPSLGKTEAWVVVDREPGSLIYAGLQTGVDREALERALKLGTSAECLHTFEPEVGDCIFVPAGMVHAIGAGLVIAEIQQASDVTYRLYDFDRVGPDGKLRPLHIEQALEAIDYRLGPGRAQHPEPTSRQHVSRLVQCDRFVLDRWTLSTPQPLGGDGRFHLIAVLQGNIRIAGDPSGLPLEKGQTALIPASSGQVLLEPHQPTTLLDIYLP